MRSQRIKSILLTLSFFILLLTNVEASIFGRKEQDSANESLQNDRISEDIVKHPVILIPAFGASQIRARLNRTNVIHDKCQKVTDWYNIWVNISEVFRLDCFIDDFKRVYNSVTGRTENTPGVETEVPGWGETSTVENLVRLPLNFKYAYFDSLINKLERDLGYQRGKSIRAAPYDFRLAPYENEEFFRRLEELIEDTYLMNNKTSVLIICHSMGCLHSYHFLLNRDQEWKEKFIRAWIPIGAPLGGSIDAVRSIAHGGAVMAGIYEFKLGKMGLMFSKTWSSLPYLLPDGNVWRDKVILSLFDGNQMQNYTAQDMKKIFELLNHTEGYLMWKKSRGMFGNYDHPGVEVHCIVGRGSPTPETIRYNRTDLFPLVPEVLKGEGDGTVNGISSDICAKWASDKRFNESTFTSFYEVTHVTLVRNDKVTTHIVDEVMSINGQGERSEESIAAAILSYLGSLFSFR